MAIDYGRFNRLVARVQEIVDAPGAPLVVTLVYRDVTRAPLSRFAAAHAAVDAAMTNLNRANLDLSRALAPMVRRSDTALAALAAVYPAIKRPAPLRSQPTDTDKRQMLQRLLTLIGHHAGEDWADALLQAEFGTGAAAFIQRIDDVLEASNHLEAARRARAESFQGAWKAFLAYKRLIRSFFGTSSRQYQRLRVRTLDAAGQEEAPPEQPEQGEERGTEHALSSPRSPNLPVHPSPAGHSIIPGHRGTSGRSVRSRSSTAATQRGPESTEVPLEGMPRRVIARSAWPTAACRGDPGRAG